MKSPGTSLFVTRKCCLAVAVCCPILLQQFAASAAVPVVGLWRFNEASGAIANDASGLGNHGALAGENGNVPAWASGQSGFGGALRFTNNGADHAYVSIPGSTSLKIGQTASTSWSITAWVYEDSNGTSDFVAAYGRILVFDNGEAFQLESGAGGDGEMYTWSRQNLPWQQAWGIGSTVSPLLDEWVHWAVVYDGANLTLYRNGNQGAQGGTMSVPVTAPLAYPAYSGAVLIGSELAASADRTWNGLLDDIAVFAGALTEAEVRTVMTGDFSAHLGGPAHILSQPHSQVVPPGSDVSFTVAAQGLGPIHYQWLFNTNTTLAGATNATLLLTNVQSLQSGIYSVVVTNALATETSQPATLIVNTNRILLVGLWRFNEGAGTNAIDSSGLNNNGILVGENGNVPAWTTGQPGFGGALQFTNNGSDHAYVTIPGRSLLMVGQTATNPWTMTAWAYEDSNGTSDFVAQYGRIVVLDDGEAFQFESGASGDGQTYTWSRATPAWQFGWASGSPVSPLLDQWEHWAVVYDGSHLSLYRNGNQGAQGGTATQSVTAALGYPAYSGSVLIGSELAQSGNRTWNGMLDDVAIFNTALSESEIRTVMTGDFNSFITRPGLSLESSQRNLVLSWSALLPGFQLQSASNLSQPQWNHVSTEPVLQGPVITLMLPVGTAPQFFRLVSP